MSELDERPSPDQAGASSRDATSILCPNGDWTRVVDAAQGDARDDEAWARSVVGAAKGLFLSAYEPSLAVVEHSPTCDSAQYRALTMPHALPNRRDPGLSMLGVSGFRTFYYPSTTAITHLEIERMASPDTASIAAAFRGRIGVHDALALFAYPEPGIVVTLFATHDRAIHLSRWERGLLARVALHLETSYRLRRRPEVVKAVLDADGRVLQRSPGAPPDHVLTAHATQRARARGERDRAYALDLWPALISGRLSLVERGSGTKRRYLVVENAAASQPIRALTPAEVEVVSQASRGLSTKLIGYALGVSPSVVSSRLSSATSKLGAASRMELIRLASMLTRDPRARFTDIVLTDAERDVLALLQHGLSNEQIARMRSRSIRTIANQVASLLRKTKSASRRELVVLPRQQGRDGEPQPAPDVSSA
jgi:DNA-binding CsgD family transcriptional regulator